MFRNDTICHRVILKHVLHAPNTLLKDATDAPECPDHCYAVVCKNNVFMRCCSRSNNISNHSKCSN